MREPRPVLPWVVWGAAVLTYVIAIVDRSSLVALGPATQSHFGIDATTLSLFAVIQLIVYASLQIPVGALLDRLGATVMILGGGLLMVLGQLAMATAHDVGLAILARMLVGAGDACTFISVIRLLPEWFSPRQIPVVNQLTGLLGQMGQLVSVTPLALAVTGLGWATGFIGVAAAGLLAVVLGALVIRDRPGGGTAVERMLRRRGRISREALSYASHHDTADPGTDVPPTASNPPKDRDASRAPGFWRTFRMLVGIPGVRLAFWAHFTPPLFANVLLLLWGTPFLVGGVGLSPAGSAALLSIAVIANLIAAATLGPLTARLARQRVAISLSIASAIALVWIAVVIWPGTPPIGLLALLMIVAPIGYPASMIAFDVVRPSTPRRDLGLATGFVNMGGFTASLIGMLVIGIVLDLQGSGEPGHYSLTAFRWAFAGVIPVWAFGFGMVLVERERTRRRTAHGDPTRP